MKNFKETFRKLHQLDAGMLAAIILLTLLLPISICCGEYLSAVCNALWVFVGYKFYRLHFSTTEIARESAEIIEEQDRLIRTLKEIIHNIITKQTDTDKVKEE